MKTRHLALLLTLLLSACARHDLPPAPAGQFSGVIYSSNSDCIVAGRHGSEIGAEAVGVAALYHPDQVSKGCYRVPMPTAADAKNPIIGKHVSWGDALSTGGVLGGDVIQYVGSTDEVIVKGSDGEIHRLSARGVYVYDPHEAVKHLNVVSAKTVDDRTVVDVILTHDDDTKSSCSYKMHVQTDGPTIEQMKLLSFARTCKRLRVETHTQSYANPT
jgi:hypothetical protein